MTRVNLFGQNAYDVHWWNGVLHQTEISDSVVNGIPLEDVLAGLVGGGFPIAPIDPLVGSTRLYVNPGVGGPESFYTTVESLMALMATTPFSSGPLVDSTPFTVQQEWNDGADLFTGLKVDVNDVASLAGSKVLDLVVDGLSVLSVDKFGSLSTQGSIASVGPVAGISTDEKSITIYARKHIMRRAIGSSDCPMIESTTPGESVNNAAKLKTALETYGHLNAGPSGASYDLASVGPDMQTQPLFVIEGNGTQTFVALAADMSWTGGINYGPLCSMFRFVGTISNNETPSVSIVYGKEARLLGINIRGAFGGIGNGGGTQYCTIPILGRAIDRLCVEDCTISHFKRGHMIAATGVRYGGRLNRNRIFDCEYDTAVAASPETYGVCLDDNKPTAVAGSTVDAIAWCDGFEIGSNEIWDLSALNPAAGAGKQTDGINFQPLSRNHRVHDNHLWNLGEGIDGGPWGSTLVNNRIHDCFTAMKLVYGLKDAIVSGNVLSDLLCFGFEIGASGNDVYPTMDILISNNRVFRVNMANSVAFTSAALHILFNAATHLGMVQRLTVQDNVLDPLGLARTILIEGQTDALKLFNNQEVVRGSAIAFTNSALANGRTQTQFMYKPTDQVFSTYVDAILSADVTGLTGNSEFVKVATNWFEQEDRNGNFNPTTGVITITEPGNYAFTHLTTFIGAAAGHTSFNVFIRTKNSGGTTLKDWAFTYANIEPNPSGQVGTSGTVHDEFIAASLPVTVELWVQAIGGASGSVGLKGGGTGFVYTNLTAQKI